jgi:hypothetical protein
MVKWSVDETREWLMRSLYDKYVKDEQASMRWSAASGLEATDSHPHGEDIIRECGQLADLGWVEILTEAYGYLFARMTPAGQGVWETFLREKESDPSAVLPPE